MTETIGQRLKAAREGQRLTLEKAFEATRIRVQYLQALEADDLSIMPSPVQARGYLRNYAEYLGFDVDQMLREQRELNDQAPSGEVIGPADTPPPTVEDETPEVQPAPQVPEPVNAAQDAPPDEEITVPVKQKPARRSQITSESAPAIPEPRAQRRSRRKTSPDVIPSAEAESAIEQETSLAIEPAHQPEQVEEPEMQVTPAAPPEASPEGALDESQETSQTAGVGDTIWKGWLSRLGSIFSAGAKQQTLTPGKPPPADDEIFIPKPVPDVPAQVEVQHRLHENAAEILKEIGSELRQRRELLNLRFDEVERTTHVKIYYLEALERGDLEELPSTVQTRGMLSNYATFLDLDVDALLLRFADALQARHRERNPQKPARKAGQPILANLPPMRSFIAGDMIFGVGMAVLLVGFAIWGVSRVIAIQNQEDVNPTAPSISDVLLSTPDPASFTATATFLPAVESLPGEATVTVEIPTQNVNADVQLNLVAVERTYMRVAVDGRVVFDGRVVPGNAYPFEAETQIEVLVGSGAAIRIVYNGRDLGLMGTFGQVVNNIYLGTEIVTPTGLPTLTPTVTLTPTGTAPPTATSRFTDTPLPSPTAAP